MYRHRPASRRALRHLAWSGVALALAGCGTQGFAPDALAEDPRANAFLSQVDRACGDLNLGTATIRERIQSQDDVYFVDETTKLFFGDISRAQYSDDITGFYPVGNASRAIACVFQQLPTQPPKR